jgi:hypothetical protein
VRSGGRAGNASRRGGQGSRRACVGWRDNSLDGEMQKDEERERGVRERLKVNVE